MRANPRRSRAFVKIGPLTALVVVSAAVAIYYWTFALSDRQLSSEIVGFEVTSEPDEARNPPIRESLAATVRFANAGGENETISKARFLMSSEEDLSEPRS